jgi:hypothetical protein
VSVVGPPPPPGGRGWCGRVRCHDRVFARPGVLAGGSSLSKTRVHSVFLVLLSFWMELPIAPDAIWSTYSESSFRHQIAVESNDVVDVVDRLHRSITHSRAE